MTISPQQRKGKQCPRWLGAPGSAALILTDNVVGLADLIIPYLSLPSAYTGFEILGSGLKLLSDSFEGLAVSCHLSSILGIVSSSVSTAELFCRRDAGDPTGREISDDSTLRAAAELTSLLVSPGESVRHGLAEGVQVTLPETVRCPCGNDVEGYIVRSGEKSGELGEVDCGWTRSEEGKEDSSLVDVR